MSSLSLDLTTLPASTRSILAQQARAARQSLQERAAAALIEAVGRPSVDPVGLTPKQAELLSFIDDRLRATSVAPSFDEMMEAVGLKSKSGIHRMINALEERGRIRRLHNRARAIEVAGGVR